jgi:hypothetical protein
VTDPLKPTKDDGSAEEPDTDPVDPVDWKIGGDKLLKDLTDWVLAGEPDIWPESGVYQPPITGDEPEIPGGSDWPTTSEPEIPGGGDWLTTDGEPEIPGDDSGDG